MSLTSFGGGWTVLPASLQEQLSVPCALGVVGLVLANASFVLSAWAFDRYRSPFGRAHCLPRTFLSPGMGRLTRVVMRDERVCTVARWLYCFQPASIFMSSLYVLTTELLSRACCLNSFFPGARSTVVVCVLMREWMPPPPGSYTEPFFAAASLSGLLALHRGRTLLAALCFAAATAIRSNGILLCVFLVLPLLGRLRTLGSSGHSGEEDSGGGMAAALVHWLGQALYCGVLCALVVAPFVLFQRYGAARYCDSPEPVTGVVRPYCDGGIVPNVYGFIQEHYWYGFVSSSLFRWVVLTELSVQERGAVPVLPPLTGAQFPAGSTHPAALLPRALRIRTDAHVTAADGQTVPECV